MMLWNNGRAPMESAKKQSDATPGTAETARPTAGPQAERPVAAKPANGDGGTRAVTLASGNAAVAEDREEKAAPPPPEKLESTEEHRPADRYPEIPEEEEERYGPDTEKGGLLTARQKAFLHRHKGTVSLALAAGLYALSYFVPDGWAYWIGYAGEASLIGGLVDFMAIRMLFYRYSFLPGSGVIPRNRERIIDALANAVEREWLTPETIKQRLAKLDLNQLLQNGLRRLKDNEELLDTILHQISQNGVRWVDSPQFLDFLASKIREKVGRVGKFAHNVGVVDIDEIAVSAAENLATEIKKLPENEEIKQIIRDQLSHMAEETSQSMTINVRMERMKNSIIDTVFSQLEGRIAEMVHTNLSRFDDERIREMFETKTKTHLEWIRVNGAVYGALFGLGFAALHHFLEANGG